LEKERKKREKKPLYWPFIGAFRPCLLIFGLVTLVLLVKRLEYAFGAHQMGYNGTIEKIISSTTDKML
jgi:hypothetical protein